MVHLIEWESGPYHKTSEYAVLDSKVMCVAVSNSITGENGTFCDWAAYISCVSGKDHEIEHELLVRHDRIATKLSYEIAKLLFPQYDEKYSWRE